MVETHRPKHPVSWLFECEVLTDGAASQESDGVLLPMSDCVEVGGQMEGGEVCVLLHHLNVRAPQVAGTDLRTLSIIRESSLEHFSRDRLDFSI